MDRGIGQLVHSVARAVLPSLRLVALVYTALSGIAVLVLVITASIAPQAPIVQQVTVPAHAVVATYVQPTTDMIGSLLPAPVPSLPQSVPTAAPTVVPFVDTTSLDVIIDEAPAPPPAYVVSVRRPVVRYLPPPVLSPDESTVDDASDDEASVEDVPVVTPEPIVEPAQVPMVQMASVEPPKPLPTPMPTPVPETPQMVKARVDAANQAAIDAAKAAAARAKADADAANQAAIDAQKAATSAPSLSAAALLVPSPDPTAVPTATPKAKPKR